jgi:WD40 repeat protein
LRELEGHTQRIWTVAFHPDGNRIATGSADLTVRVWDANTAQSVLTLAEFSNPVYNVVFSPDGNRLYANSSGSEIAVFEALQLQR